MTVQVSYPGVYIVEFAPGAPIQGVGTSTAAFIGIAERGPLNEPVKLTSFAAFMAAFGPLPVQGTYLWYAVRGFFENGGQVCYVVRASNGSYQRMTLNDRTTSPGRPVVDLQARQPGAFGIVAELADAALLSGVAVYRPAATVQGAVAAGAMELSVAAEGTITAASVANRFKPGDEVSFSSGTDRRVVSSVSGAVVRFTLPLSQALALGATLHLANTAAGTRTIRLRPAGSAALPAGQLVPGTILTVTQGSLSDTQVVETVLAEVLTEGEQGGLAPVSYRVTLRAGLNLQLDLDPASTVAPTASSNEINLAVTIGSVTVVYDRLSMDATHPRYLIDIVNNDSGGLLSAALVEPPPPNSVALAIPRTGAAAPTSPAEDGTAEDLSTLSAGDFVTAIDTLRALDDVNIVAVPDRPTAQSELMSTVQQALISHCELQADRFAVLDCDPGLPLFGAGSLEEQRRGLDSTRGYAAFYAPWLRVLPASGGPPILVPPSGQVCGIFARSDSTRGVHKAPANEIVNGALGVETRISLIEQGQLNPLGINIVQVFQDGGRPVLWGARTTATDRNWQYVNIRRLFLFLEKSIQRGILWSVFEPNNLSLWQKLKRTLTDFLTRSWRDGALFGAKAEEAFYVRIDAVNNSFSEQQLGRLNIEVGVRPSFTAEFIVVRIGIWDGGSDISES
ncbi:phage tail sheath subtilisin-like domain-containing protein [Variovorax sp. YR752]|uniref:phage tail sheath subtilisin-like domain-containing protein n=1 Tax=Variovorax sp. YR752 TaxID=1884383 RepID=UPI0031382222